MDVRVHYRKERLRCFSVPYRNSALNTYVRHAQDTLEKHKDDILIHTLSGGYCRCLGSALHNCILYTQELNKGKTRLVFTIEDDDAATMFITSFANVIIHQNHCTKYGTNKQRYNAYLVVFTGNRNWESGLETVIMYYDRQSKGPVVYGVSINTPLAKFYSNISEISDESQTENLLVKDENGMFYFVHDLHDNYCISSYQTKRTETKNADDVLKWIHTIHPNSINEHVVPMKHCIVDLLCIFDEEIFFTVIQDTMIKIGKMFFDTNGMKTQIINLVTELEIGLSIKNLKPLTMMKDTNDKIVACSVRDDNTKFVIIRQRDKPQLKHVITMLSVRYDPLEKAEVEEESKWDTERRRDESTDEGGHEISEATVEQFDMSPDGDILYVLKNKVGQSFACRTKFLI